MRIDKYLKVSRLIKRRTVACDACDGEHILVNGKLVKPSYQVKLGDEIEIRFGQRTLVVRVLSTVEHIGKAEASSMFEVVSQT